jgi:hypothetical protein
MVNEEVGCKRVVARPRKLWFQEGICRSIGVNRVNQKKNEALGLKIRIQLV